MAQQGVIYLRNGVWVFAWELLFDVAQSSPGDLRQLISWCVYAGHQA